MKSKQILTIVSGSALASGMAHGAILYSGILNSNFPCPASFPAQGDQFDVNQDGLYDFYLGFDGLYSPNSQKPYIVGYPSSDPGSTVLARLGTFTNSSGQLQTSYGLPVTPFGTMIDSNYLAPIPASASPDYAYFNQDGNANYTGDWQDTAKTEAYVGLELWDATGTTNNYGWARIIYDGTISPKALTLVDYGYETAPFTGIVAGSTNEIGAPDIYVQPQSQTNGVGAAVQISVTMLASPAPTFQWQVGPTNGLGPYVPLTDGGIISGSTNSTLTINGATLANQADYRVVISNSLGAVTSSPAALTLVSPVVTPTSPVLFAGFTANFNVSITGGLTPTYQWQKNGVNLANGGRISGVNNNTLQISNLQGTDAGSYDVVLNFGASPSPSTVSVLTVLPLSQESLYDAAVLADDPVVYYRLNETGNPASSNLVAYDNAGGFNGTYGIDVTNGFSGIEGPDAADGYPGFGSDNDAVLINPNDTNSWITLPPWNLNTNTVTFTAWVNPVAIPSVLSGVVMTGPANGRTAGIDYYFEDDTNNNDNVYLGYRWNQGPGNTEDSFFGSFLVTPTDEWSFAAVAITSTNASLYVFNSEGTNSSVDYIVPPNQGFDPNGATNLVTAFNVPEYVGTDVTGSFGSENFNGMIDNVAVFGEALNLSQLSTLYNAALGVLPVTLQISPSGFNIQITWPVGTLLQATNLTGPWTTNSVASSPFTVTPTGASMFYQVVVP